MKSSILVLAPIPRMPNGTHFSLAHKLNEAMLAEKKEKVRRRLGITRSERGVTFKPTYSEDPEKAQISIQDADHLYREIRVENVLTDEKGERASLRPGAKGDVLSKPTQSPQSKSRIS